MLKREIPGQIGITNLLVGTGGCNELIPLRAAAVPAAISPPVGTEHR
jgi:hypothetical protein